MDFNLSKEQELIQKNAVNFGKEKVEPIAADIETDLSYPADTVKAMASIGFFGLGLPPEFGGAGDFLAYALVLEGLGRFSASVAAIVQTHCSLAAYPISQYGGPEIKKAYLPDLAKGAKLGGYALAEPDAAPASGPNKVAAVQSGDMYILNGQKSFAYNGGVADVYIVYAATGPETGVKGLSAFVVDAGTAGLTVGKQVDKLGLRSLPTTELTFKDVRIPVSNLLGGEGQGSDILADVLARNGVASAAIALGILQAGLDASVRYAKERIQFGAPIAQLQGVQYMLAETAAYGKICESLLYRTASVIAEGKPYEVIAAALKMYAAKAAVDAAWNVVQIHGGSGYSKESPIERYYRDSKGCFVMETTAEYPQKIIAASLLK
jgi:alkylation response protein AidB-like acyl-CoA dehydrogenase